MTSDLSRAADEFEAEIHQRKLDDEKDRQIVEMLRSVGAIAAAQQIEDFLNEAERIRQEALAEVQAVRRKMYVL